jgi:hypothetical protein
VVTMNDKTINQVIILFVACISFWIGTIYMDTVWRMRVPMEMQFCYIDVSPAMSGVLYLIVIIALLGIGFLMGHNLKKLEDE